jgi:hypothetical protein
MRKVASIAGLLALGFASTAALAASWSDFESAFPVMPCQDGWAGCVVDGEVVNPDMRDNGAPMPADLRVSWFTLEPTASFSPYPSLSQYSGELPQTTEPPAVADADPPEDDGMDDGGGFEPTEPPPPVRNTGGGSSGGGSTGGSSGGMASGGGSGSGGSGGSGSGGSGGSAGGTAQPSGEGGDGVSIAQLSGGGSGGTADGGGEETSNAIIEASLKEKPAAAAGSGDCSNIKMLEPKAMLGKLSPEQAKCLEGELAAAPKQTTKDKISRVLMTNAWSSGDKGEWERLVKRHLDEIDRSDPDICYKYALHLSKKGAWYGVIRWSDVALENRTVWTGSTYTNRVNSLYKLRAAAAQRLWQSAETKYSSDASDENRAARDEARNKTKVLAREWYEYAKSAGKNADKARALCISAAGTEDYCEAS